MVVPAFVSEALHRIINRSIRKRFMSFSSITIPGMAASSSQPKYDHMFKLLLIGDPGVGKNTLSWSITCDTLDNPCTNIAVDYRIKYATVGGKNLKLVIWDIVGQERSWRPLPDYYSGAHGIVMVYDVTRRKTFTNIAEKWVKEIDAHSTNHDCVKMLIGNKVDKVRERIVSKKEGKDLARKHGCLYQECSAANWVNVDQAFEQLVAKVVEVEFPFVEASLSTSDEFDYLFKLVLIGDGGVGKTTLLTSFISKSFEKVHPTIGVDFGMKHLTVGGQKLKVVIWDTAGQERFRTLTSAFYRGAQGIIMVYDVTRRKTFTHIDEIWAKEIKERTANGDCIKMLVGNKVDMDTERVVSKKEGKELARKHECLFLESSAKTLMNVQQFFEQLVRKILETPSLRAECTSAARFKTLQEKKSSRCCSS